MSIKKAVTASIVAGAVAMAVANTAQADTHEKEKCYGVVKAGANDCGSADKSHSCMGHATKDADPNEWVAVPAGLCEKLVGGTLKGGASSCEGKDGCEGKNGCEGKEG